MLKIIEHLPVFPGITDTALIDNVERQDKSQSYIFC